MKKIKNSNKNNIVEKSAALGFFVGSILWFCIYFPKNNLNFGKMVLYMFLGLFVGGIIGEIYIHFKK